MRITLFTAAAASTLILLAGCSSDGSVTNDPSVGSNSDRGEAGEDEADEEKPRSSVASFGDTYEWDDLEVTVGVPVAFTPGEYAAVGEHPAYVSFEIAIVNTGDEPYDPSAFYTTLQSGTSEGEEVFDSENGYAGSPTTPLLPGREARFMIGYGVSDPADLVMQISPSFEFEGALFAS